MKMYEDMEAQRRHMPGLPVLARIDGRCFSTLTRGLGRPYDPRFANAMIDTTITLVERTNARTGYTQSDEITLVWEWPYVFFEGRIQKMTSVLASLASVRFSSALMDNGLGELTRRYPQFDCRTWTVPSKEEAANVFMWRELDATKNSISMAARAQYSHKELHGKSGQQMKDMLRTAGIDWDDYPALFKRGTYVQRRRRWLEFSPEERARLPPKHVAHSEPDLQVERTEVVGLIMSPLRQVTNRVEVFFDGADPITTEPL